jgi:1,4-alpha-glucan branching enzyme
MTKISRAHLSNDNELADRVLKQLARELLLAQSSDWAFLIKTGTAKHYATKRVTNHLLRFNRLYDEVASGNVDEGFLANCEWRDNIFPEIDWRCYV